MSRSVSAVCVKLSHGALRARFAQCPCLLELADISQVSSATVDNLSMAR